MRTRLDQMFGFIFVANILLFFLVMTGMAFNLGDEIFWHDTRITHGVEQFPRLMLMAYEPAHYSLLLSPVFIYYTLKAITGQVKQPLLYLSGVAIPLIVSLSFGVIAAMGLSLLIILSISFRKLPAITRIYFAFGLMTVAGITVAGLIFVPDHLVFIRIENIITGMDTSAGAHIKWAYNIATDMVLFFKAWMGVGPGQVKLLVLDLIRDHYHIFIGAYDYRIPNSMAEMLATYGFYGVILKLALEWYFFFKLKIYTNLFSLTLFAFIFIHQFTGSFYINVAELGTWALVYQGRIHAMEFSVLK